RRADRTDPLRPGEPRVFLRSALQRSGVVELDAASRRAAGSVESGGDVSGRSRTRAAVYPLYDFGGGRAERSDSLDGARAVCDGSRWDAGARARRTQRGRACPRRVGIGGDVVVVRARAVGN